MTGVTIGALGVAVNVVCYMYLGHHCWNVASAIFCGFMALYAMALDS